VRSECVSEPGVSWQARKGGVFTRLAPRPDDTNWKAQPLNPAPGNTFTLAKSCGNDFT